MNLNRIPPPRIVLGISILFFLLPLKINAQNDNTFWFTAPEVTSDHGDADVVLRLTAFDNDAEVTIAMPANGGFSEQTIDVAANTQETFQFSGPDIVENKPAGQVNDKGILITSDVDISAYYEVTHGNNPDKFTLKGDNALGTEFFVPSQDAFQNHRYKIPAKEHADIVATEDDTQVEVTVSDDVEGHAAGSTFTINLDRGETYSLTSTSRDADRHLGGTQISSNKPIAVTISDDSIEIPDEAGCWDLIGDQLIPVNILGNEYIAMNPLYGEGVSDGVHKVFVLAVEDGTFLYVNGEEDPKVELSQGELHELDITNNGLYLNSNKPFYAYQVTGIPHQGSNPPAGVELGSAILPNIVCTGSSSVSFTRTLNERFYVQLMTEEDNRDAFQIDGHDNGGGHNDFPDNLNWVQVPGTGNNGTDETWYTAIAKLGDVGTGLSTGSPYTISNTEGIFHLSILDENNGSMSFGYFSDYSTLRIYGYELTCAGETLTLETRDPEGTYYWYYEDDIHNPISEDPTSSIEISEPGKYWVEEDGGCFQTDTVDVEFSMPDFSLGNDTAVCPGETVTWEIEANNEDDEFLWQPGDITSNRYEVTPDPDEEVEVTLTMTDPLGCSRTESVTVTGYSPPEIDWNISGEDICLGDTLRTETGMDGYQWTVDGNTDPADTLSYIVPDHSGVYELTVYTEDNCSETQSLDLTVHDLPQPVLDDVSECPGEEATFNPGSFDAYLWHDDSENASYTATSPEKVKVTVTDHNGCMASDSANFEWYNESVFTFGEDTSVCVNDDIHIAVDDIAASGSDYEWTFREDGTGPEQTLSTNTHELDITNASHSDEGLYAVATVDDNGCDVEDDFYLTVEDVPDLDLEDGNDICRGDTIKIATQDHRFVEFEWRDSDDNLLSEENFVLVSEEDTYELTAWQANGCSQNADTEVTVYDSPTFDLNDETVCPNANTEIEMENWYSPQSGDDEDPRDFTWSTGDPRKEYATTEALEDPEEGTYYLTVYDGLCFNTEKVEVTHHDLPDIELDDDTFCENETYTLQIPSDLDSEASSYFWEQNNPSVTGSPDSDMDVTDEGDYTLHITDDNGCESSGELTLSHLPAPDFSLGSDRDKCPGDTIMIETDPSFTRYEWNGDTSDDQPHFTEATSSGNYTLRVWNEEGCSSEEEVDITLRPAPDVDLGGDREACAGEKFELEVDDYEEIYWTNGDKDVRSITASEGRHGVLVVNEYGCAGGDTIHVNWHPVPDIDLGPDLSICPADYPVTIEAPAGFERYQWQTGSNSRRIHAQLRDTVNKVNVWDENNCRAWDTKGVKTINEPGYSLGEDIEACEPEEVSIDAGTEIAREYGGEEDVSNINEYEWNTGSSNQEITVNESGQYHVEVFDGCFYLQDTVQVEYFPAPEIVALDTSIYAQVRVLTEDGTKPYRYALDDDSRMQDENTFKNVEDGTHTVYVEDDKECRATTEFSIQSEYDINVPGFFTPNNDGFNDTWEIEGIERLPESVIFIFDRYGKLLLKYKASDQPWDGEYMGRPVPSDDYWYVIHLKPVNKYLKGNVTIKR